jgi:hypothetical protein
MLQNSDHLSTSPNKNSAARGMIRAAHKDYNFTASVNSLQHKSLLPFLSKKVIAGKVKLSGSVEVDHD